MGRIAIVAAIGFPMVVYVMTLAREITFVDSGELAAVAATLGIAHPPGYPLFTLLGRLFAALPVGTVAFRVGLMSAAATAAAAGIIVVVAGALLRSDRDRAGSFAATLTDTLAALAGAWCFAFALTPWSQAVVVEVYALQALLVVLFLLACQRALGSGSRSTRLWPAVAFTLGLAMTNHLTGMLLVPGALALAGITLRDRRRDRDREPLPVWRSLGALVTPLALYLYLPLRARLSPPVAWSDLDSVQSILVHLSARQYHGLLGREGVRVSELGRFLREQLPAEGSWVLVAFGAIGLVSLMARQRRFALVSLVTMAAFLVYNMAYPIHDISFYYIPCLAILGVWAAFGAGALARWAGGRHRIAGVGVALILCASTALPLVRNRAENDRSDFRLIARYVHDALRHVDAGAVVFSGRWDSFSSPALYYQNVERYRPDVLVIDMGMLSHPSLARRLAVKAPELVAACRDELDEVAVVARDAEAGRPYDVGKARAAFKELQRKLAVQASGLRPTYVTGDLLQAPIFSGFQLIPEGLVARVSLSDRPLGDTPALDGPDLTLSRAGSQQERDIISEYAMMVGARSRYLLGHGRNQEARELAARAAAMMR